MKYTSLLAVTLLFGCGNEVELISPDEMARQSTDEGTPVSAPESELIPVPEPDPDPIPVPDPDPMPTPEVDPIPVPDPDPMPVPDPIPAPEPPLVSGDRADWLRGSWGINWKPVDLSNGRSETLSIDGFLEQISGFKTLDYLQLHLGDSYTSSPVHLGPNSILESLWQGDIGTDGKPYNLVVPRAAANVDPFMDILVATKSHGLKTMIYVNSSNMLERDDEDNPDPIRNITERWKAFCDTNAETQAFLASKDFHYDEAFPNRHYMFCYAEFVLKEYSILYGDLIDGWLFDSGEMMAKNGDNATNGQAQDQEIYKAFADAARVGNPLAAVSYNNGPERETEELNPFSEAVLYEDYMFGHPYNGGRVIGDHEKGLYQRNYAHIQKVTETGGNIHVGGEWTWDDKVVGHFDPPLSTSSWKGGSTPALTDEEFLLWNLESARGGGAISWGVPLFKASGELQQLNIQDWGMAQLTLMDDHLSINQEPGAPNWARAETYLPYAPLGQIYSHTLVEGVDFWDPEADAISLSIADSGNGVPDWLTLEADPSNAGHWIFSGRPTEGSATTYEFNLQAQDASGVSERSVKLLVDDLKSPYPYKGNIDIFATADTSYGIDATAVMTSKVITAPDGLATFKLRFNVSPATGQQVISGATSAASNSQSWGIGDDAMFRGNEGDVADSIANLRVINFNANGGSLTEASITNLSFEYALIADGQSTGDRILIDVNGVTNTDGGTSLVSNPDTISLKILGYIPVTNFKIGVGNDLTTDKWVINSINASYTVEGP